MKSFLNWLGHLGLSLIAVVGMCTTWLVGLCFDAPFTFYVTEPWMRVVVALCCTAFCALLCIIPWGKLRYVSIITGVGSLLGIFQSIGIGLGDWVIRYDTQSPQAGWICLWLLLTLICIVYTFLMFLSLWASVRLLFDGDIFLCFVFLLLFISTTWGFGEFLFALLFEGYGDHMFILGLFAMIGCLGGFWGCRFGSNVAETSQEVIDSVIDSNGVVHQVHEQLGNDKVKTVSGIELEKNSNGGWD